VHQIACTALGVCYLERMETTKLQTLLTLLETRAIAKGFKSDAYKVNMLCAVLQLVSDLGLTVEEAIEKTIVQIESL